MTDSVKEGFLVRLRKQFAVADDAEIAEQVADKIDETESSNRRRLIKEDPYEEHRAALAKARADFRAGNSELPSIRADLDSYKLLAKQAKERADESFFADGIGDIEKQEKYATRRQAIAHKLAKLGRTKKLPANIGEQIADERKTLRGLLQERWQKTFDKAHSEWEMNKIAEYRRQLFSALEEWLRLLQQFADVMRQLCITPGRLFDLSKDGLSFSDIEEMKRWAAYLSQDEGAHKLCEMLGRLRVAARAKREKWIKKTEFVPEIRPDINSCEEISGVCAGNSIEYALAQEKSMLADEDVAALFYLKFAENRLLQFEMRGFAEVDVAVKKNVLIEVAEEEKMGPMIICVDTSGSMHGMPETIAKAVTLHMATKAHSQNRNCYLINFSTDIETMDLSGHVSLPKLMEFLRRSFRGGTDVAPAIAHALEMTKTENYKKSDTLIISDFLMDELPSDVRAAAMAAKENDNKFYSLSIGEMFGKSALGDLFEQEWVYNPAAGSVRRLLDIGDAAAERKV